MCTAPGGGRGHTQACAPAPAPAPAPRGAPPAANTGAPPRRERASSVKGRKSAALAPALALLPCGPLRVAGGGAGASTASTCWCAKLPACAGVPVSDTRRGRRSPGASEAPRGALTPPAASRAVREGMALSEASTAAAACVGGASARDDSAGAARAARAASAPAAPPPSAKRAGRVLAASHHSAHTGQRTVPRSCGGALPLGAPARPPRSTAAQPSSAHAAFSSQQRAQYTQPQRAATAARPCGGSRHTGQVRRALSAPSKTTSSTADHGTLPLSVLPAPPHSSSWPALGSGEREL